MSDKSGFAQSPLDDEETEDLTVHESSGNVFADLAFDNPDEELLKADLVIMLGRRIETLKLSQTKAAQKMGVSQPDVSKMLRGRTEGYSLDRLFVFLNRLGVNIEIVVTTNEKAPDNEGWTRLRRKAA